MSRTFSVFLLIAVTIGAGCAKDRTPPATPGQAQAAPPAGPAPAPSPEPASAAAPAPAPASPAAAPPSSYSPSGELLAATRENPLRPEPFGTIFRNHPASPSMSPPRLEALKLPDGFSIDVYTNQVPHARSLALGPRGILYVSTRRDNRVYAVVDKNGDYKADRVYTVAEGLDSPNGIAYRKGTLYIAEIGRLLRIDGIDNRLARPPKPVVIAELPTERQHGWRYIRFGPDGWLYMPIGAPCNICKRDEPIFASITRMKPDGSGREVFASGVRNSVGYDWHPKTGELWFTENGRDELGNDIPPDELNRASRAGLNFGFPHCHAGVILDPEFGTQPCTEFEPPVQLLGPHAGALGMRFYTGKMFPPEYADSIIIAEHGSWNRQRKFGYRLAVVRLDRNKAVSYEPLVSGWLDEKVDEAWGRPVDVEQLDDGSLLISDDWKGVIYRLTYRK